MCVFVTCIACKLKSDFASKLLKEITLQMVWTLERYNGMESTGCIQWNSLTEKNNTELCQLLNQITSSLNSNYINCNLLGVLF